MERQRQLEDVNQRLIAKAHEIRQNLQNKILPTDEEYRVLKSTDVNSEQMSLKDFIMVGNVMLLLRFNQIDFRFRLNSTKQFDR